MLGLLRIHRLSSNLGALQTKFQSIDSRIIGQHSFSSLDHKKLADHQEYFKEIKIPIPGENFLAAKYWKKGPEIHESSSNSNKTKILCLHGWQDNSGSFDTLIPQILTENIDIVAIDLPGHGFSSYYKSICPDILNEGLISIISSMNYLKWDKVILLGHSIGSVISYLFSGNYPERVEAYIGIENFYPLAIEKNFIKSHRSLLENVFKIEEKLALKLSPPSYSYEEILERTFLGRDKNIDLEACKLLLKRGAIKNKDGKFSFSHDIRITIPSMRGRYSSGLSDLYGENIKCPVCIVKGEPGIDYDKREIFVEKFNHLKKFNSQAELHFAPGSHHVHLDSPKEVGTIINEFSTKYNLIR